MLISPETLAALLATTAMAVACAGLSVVVVARRWAFIGEGIAHSGFGGAGVAWLVMLLAPRLTNALWLPYLAIIVFCLLTALAIGYVSRSSRLSADTAIGIFMVASLAFGFLAQQIFRQAMNGAEPPGFPEILFGRFSGISLRYSMATIAVSVAVIATLLGLGKEILYYCLDPLAAQASGVPATFIHYLLMVLIALVVIIGIPITGSVLITALLVLPGATANLISQDLRRVITISVIVATLSAVAGVAVSLSIHRVHVPAGPIIVLTLFAIFVTTCFVQRVFRPAQQIG
ncbi:MAG TPA: metal ABC transporter permease [Tepidisphaeraceae bacterium]|jgi:ABC-type Mn2+/Zn2+ transport system permease subunit